MKKASPKTGASMTPALACIPDQDIERAPARTDAGMRRRHRPDADRIDRQALQATHCGENATVLQSSQAVRELR
jgi:hypothetical protein